MRSTRRSFFRAVLAAAFLMCAVTSCTSDDGDGSEGGTTSTAAPPPAAEAPAELVGEISAAIDEAPGCDWLDPSECLFPFPSARYEVADEASATGVRLGFPDGVLPVSEVGGPTDPEPFERADGWGVGSPIMVSVPGIDLAASGWAIEDDIAASVEDSSGSVLLDLETGERLAHWAEVDARPEVADDERSTVLIRPASMLPEGHRVAVALRTPVDVDGAEIEPSAGFVAYRDNLTTDIDEVEERRGDMEAVFAELAAAGVDRGDLHLAWDFQVVSTEDVTGELITMRDRAFEELGDNAPAYEITEVLTETDDGDPLPDGIAKRIRGTYEVPSFLEGDGAPGAVMTRDDDGDPVVSGVYEAEFSCSLTTRQLDGTAEARPVVYGHGLLGRYTEAERGDLGTAADDLMLCATYWIGMSDPDIGNAVATLQDIDGFSSVADRLRQGVVNQLFLGRLIGHADGLAVDPELAGPDGSSSLDTTEVFYEGHSQGGIMGFVATAVSNEWSKAVLGVGAVDYSLIMPRSNNWQTYGPVIAEGYPGTNDALIVLALIQQQWDRAEGSGYVRYVLGGLPGTQDHQVLLQVALSDHQVANAGTDVAARTAGIPVRVPVVDDDRLPWALPPHGIETVAAGETAESLMIYWDSGARRIPLGSLSPDQDPERLAECGDEEESALCEDPHEFPRRTPEAHDQRTTFFETGKIEDVCGDGPCLTAPRKRDGTTYG